LPYLESNFLILFFFYDFLYFLIYITSALIKREDDEVLFALAEEIEALA